jgi:putative hydrolase of the HAD superfamily
VRVKIKCVLFDIDDVLYDASLQAEMARLNAIRAMIEAGLPSDIENAYRILKKIVKEYGTDYSKHFDKLLERLGLKWDPRVIAAGVVAYRETNVVYLRPYPDTITTLLRLRDLGYRLGVVSDGRTVKQWQKLISLGVQHFFQYVLVSEEAGLKTIGPGMFKTALEKLSLQPGEVAFVGRRLNPDILNANRAGIVSIRMRRGESKNEEAENEEMKPKHEITKLSEILKILQQNH